jgi:cell division protein FtsW
MSTDVLRSKADKENKKKKTKKNGIMSRVSIMGVKLTVEGGFDLIYLFIMLALLTTGLVMMASASYVWAKFYEPKGEYHYIIKQLVVAVFGLVLMFIISKINPQFIKKMAIPIIAIGVILLIMVLFLYIPVPENPEIKRWMYIPGTSVRLQPSDVAKVAMIIGLAWGLEKGKKLLDTKMWAPLIYFGALAMVCVLIYLESHLSCLIMMFLIGVGILFLSGMDRRWFIVGGIVGVVAVVLIFVFRDQIFSPYQVARIESMLHRDYTDKGARWQTNNSLYALGSGGLFGLGLGNSRQKFLYLPEPHNDFIFAIVGEELGFFRSVIIILLFLALVARGFIIALRTKSMYERLVVLGISLQIGIQSVLNILVVTDVIPNTGISLPFFSYGGTALLILLGEMGLVLGISRTGERTIKKRKSEVKTDAEQ